MLRHERSEPVCVVGAVVVIVTVETVLEPGAIEVGLSEQPIFAVEDDTVHDRLSVPSYPPLPPS